MIGWQRRIESELSVVDLDVASHGGGEDLNIRSIVRRCAAEETGFLLAQDARYPGGARGDRIRMLYWLTTSDPKFARGTIWLKSTVCWAGRDPAPARQMKAAEVAYGRTFAQSAQFPTGPLERMPRLHNAD